MHSHLSVICRVMTTVTTVSSSYLPRLTWLCRESSQRKRKWNDTLWTSAAFPLWGLGIVSLLAPPGSPQDLKLFCRWLSICPSELRRNPVLSYTFRAKQPEGISVLMSTASSELAKFKLFFVQTPSNILISICFWKNSWLTIPGLIFTLTVIYKSSASCKCYLTLSHSVFVQ